MIKIRSIKENDYLLYRDIRLEMVNLYPHYFDVDRAKLNSLTDEDWKLSVIDTIQNSNNRKYLAYDKDRCIGMIGCDIADDNTMTIGSFYIAPEYRGKGLGKRLMKKCLEFSDAQNCTARKLWVSSANKSASAWYKRLGFQSTKPPTINRFEHLKIFDQHELFEECLIKD